MASFSMRRNYSEDHKFPLKTKAFSTDCSVIGVAMND